MPGMFAARKLKNRRQHLRWKEVKYRTRTLKLKEKKDPLEGAPQARGIVLEKRTIEQKQPSSGLAKAVRIQLIKNNKQITAFLPRDGAVKHVDEHDIVHVQGLHGSQGGAKGSLWGVKWAVFKVNDIALEQLRTGKKQKPSR
ncbi:MAG: 30S ribosomal protein S12 [Candidatus Aenigmatarchaeota archaeon]|nr:MAG: 30S ribosomal protein S12 [Candidatus Aenigmarchaeota archaeon]